MRNISREYPRKAGSHDGLFVAQKGENLGPEAENVQNLGLMCDSYLFLASILSLSALCL